MGRILKGHRRISIKPVIFEFFNGALSCVGMDSWAAGKVAGIIKR